MTGDQIGTNAKSVFTLASITDTNDHDLPDTDGDDGDAQDPYDVRGADRAAAIVTNHGDQDLTARLERAGALDEGFAREYKDVEGVTVPSGGGSKALAFDTDVPLAFARVVISYGTAPTSTDPSVTVEYNADHNG